MSHHIYHTEAIILGSNNFGESGRYFNIFTRELGMIHARAFGIRKISSKLRFIMQDFSHIKVDLVRGKDSWRITSASKIGKLNTISKSMNTTIVVGRIAKLLNRLLSGEEANEPLFTDVLSGLFLLEKSIDDVNGLRNIELVLVLRILFHLGYFSGDEITTDLINTPIEYELLAQASNNRNFILSKINKALKETHL